MRTVCEALDNLTEKYFLDASVICVRAGMVIVGEDTVGHYDLGIFVASIVPGGPTAKDGRIRPGRESCGFFLLYP